MFLSTVYFASFSAALVLGYLVYKAALPKPIPGIPYNEYAAGRITGDLPEAIRYEAERSEMTGFLSQQLIKLNEPVIQLFLRPFGKPWIVVADFKEAQDVMVRRSREFDRSQFFSDIFKATLPTHHAGLRLGNEWKAHRRLVGDTMSPQFLDQVLSKRVYESINMLHKLWNEKSRLALGRPFTAKNDILNASLDTIFAATFGSSLQVTSNHVDLLSKLPSGERPENNDTEAELPVAPTSKEYDATVTVTASSEIPLKSPFPVLHHWLAMNFHPKLRMAVSRKNKMINAELEKAYKRSSSSSAHQGSLRCAVDLIMQNEVQMSKKEGRPVQWNTQVMRDELFGFVIAGYETTGTVMQWALKWISSRQTVQTKLRSELHEALREVLNAGQDPTVEALCKTKVPYLDAVIEEVMRHTSATQIVNRVATVDTQILGIHIPKGTDVFFPNGGPSFLTPAFDIDENSRTQSSREAKAAYGVWDPSTIGDFLPERWLSLDENGKQVFNPRAGPSMPFGAGIRSCFGRKLAEMQLRMLVTLTVWRFDLQPVPELLSTYKKHELLTSAPQQCYLRLAKLH